MSNNKIYCNNCKWYDELIRHCCLRHFPNSPLIKSIYYDIHGKRQFNFKESNLSSHEIFDCGFNKNYTCKYYKRRWYKFWVKNVKN